MVLLSQAQEPVCRLHGDMEQPELHVDGDLIIGGIFSFRTGQDGYIDIFRSTPEVRPCREYVYVYLTKSFEITMEMKNSDLLVSCLSFN